MNHWIQPILPFTENIFDIQFDSQNKLPSKDKRTWDERKATTGLIRTDLTSSLKKTENGLPTVKAYHGSMPSAIIGLNKINGIQYQNCWLHGFSEDCVLERIWNRPKHYLDKISQMEGMLSPDFSLYLNMSPIEKKMNVFRKNAISQIAQNRGINVIYTLCWAEYDSLEYCVDGVEPNGIYAISNIGVRNDYVSRKIFRVGIKELIRRLVPKGLIVYGYPLDFKLDCEIKLFENENLARLHQLR